jgi:two-component system sensor histidine kinase GlrK
VSFLRSLSTAQLMLIAFIAVALPLMWAIFTTLYQIDELVERNAGIIVKVKKESSTSRELADQLKSLERSARQYQVLGDTTIQFVYLEHRSNFDILLNQLISNKPSDDNLNRVIALRETESLLFDLIKPSPQKKELEDTDKKISTLYQQVDNLLQATDRALAEQTETLAEQARILKQQLIAKAALAIPITLALAILFTLLITRPIRQLSKAISALGRGSLTNDVLIRGPHDIQDLSVRLNWLRRKLRQVDQQKEVFLRNMSHELKTPLASIREGTELLYTSSEATSATSIEEQRAIINILRSSGMHLQTLIEGLLHFNELTASEGEHSHISVTEMVNSIISAHQLSIQQKQIVIEQEIDLPELWLHFNSVKLIIDNLLSNAIKFSPEKKHILISVKKIKSTLSIIISDEGKGIDDEDKRKVFELFYRNDKHLQSPLSSNGLGLAIVKEMVARLHGTIELKDNNACLENQGAKFIIVFPISTSDHSGMSID